MTVLEGIQAAIFGYEKATGNKPRLISIDEPDFLSACAEFAAQVGLEDYEPPQRLLLSGVWVTPARIASEVPRGTQH